MSLASTLASVLYAALPRQLRRPVPRKSEGMREFDTLIEDLRRGEPSWTAVPEGASISVTPTACGGPTRAVMRRARH
jgi:hypothetical protein